MLATGFKQGWTNFLSCVSEKFAILENIDRIP